ncbi:hypothetical protein ES703_00874 [subsurface metagenome]|nr:S8 family serine peptidase [bacterium]
MSKLINSRGEEMKISKPFLIGLVIIICFGTIFAADVDKELLVRFKTSTASFPSAQVDSCDVDSLDVPDTVITILNSVNARYLMEFADWFSIEDTLLTTPYGDTAYFPDLTAVFKIGFDSDSARTEAMDDIDSLLDDVLWVSKNCYGEYFSYYPYEEESFSNQWNMYNTNGHDIKAKDAWEYSLGYSGPKLGISDGKVYNHVEFGDRLSYDSWTGSSQIPSRDHGTHVAGIAGAGIHNYQVAGVAPFAKLRSSTIEEEVDYPDNYEITLDGAVWSIYQLASWGNRAINTSWGFPEYEALIHEACQSAWDAGALIVS